MNKIELIFIGLLILACVALAYTASIAKPVDSSYEDLDAYSVSQTTASNFIVVYGDSLPEVMNKTPGSKDRIITVNYYGNNTKKKAYSLL